MSWPGSGDYSPPGTDHRPWPRRELSDEELAVRREHTVPKWEEEREAQAALERHRRSRPHPMLTADQALCSARPHEQLSECLRLEGHDGPHVLAGLIRGGARFYLEDGTLVRESRLWFAGPSRAELAELWAWHEETTTEGRKAVSGDGGA